MGEVFRVLTLQKKSNIFEEHLIRDHEYMLISIPPKSAASQIAGYIKGKSEPGLMQVDDRILQVKVFEPEAILTQLLAGLKIQYENISKNRNNLIARSSTWNCSDHF